MAFPVDEQYITETEKQLRLKFPTVFKDKMKIENGGEIETTDDSWTIHPFFDKSDIKRIKRTTSNIILETKNSREWDNFPPTGIAIGDNGSGDKLILLPTESVLTPYKTGQESENRFITVKLGKYAKRKKIIHTRRAIKPFTGSRTGRLRRDMSQV